MYHQHSITTSAGDDLSCGALASFYWRARQYFSQVFDVQGGELTYRRDSDGYGYEVYPVDLARRVRFGWRDVRVFWDLGWWWRAGLALVALLVKVLIGLAFKAVWLLVLGLDAAIYAGRFDWDRYDARSDAFKARHGEVQM